MRPIPHRPACLLTFFCAWIVACSPAPQAEQSAPSVEIASPPPGVVVSRLDNGLTVVAIPDPTLPMVGINVVVKAGSANESFATSGASHMLEHLLFNGTESRTQEELYADVDRIGAYNNANTSRFYTNFMMLGASEHLDALVEIQADMLLHSVLPAAKLEKERGIVIEEIVQGRDDPAAAAEHFFYDKCFPGSSVGMPIVGTPSTIERLSREEILGHYKTFYVPNNMVMSVVGGFDPDALDAVLERHWAPAPPRPLPRTDRAFTTPLPASAAYVRQGEAALSSINIAFNAPAFGDPGKTAFEAAAGILGEELREQVGGTGAEGCQGLTAYPLAWPPVGRLIVSAELAADQDAALAAEALQQVVRSWARNLPTQLEVEELQALAAGAEAEQAGLLEKPHYYGIANAEAYALSDPDQVQLKLAELARLTTADVAGAVQGLVDGPALTTIMLGQQADLETGADGGQTITTEKRVLANGLTLVVRTNPYSRVFAAHFLMRDRVLVEGDEREGWIDLIHRLIAGQGQDESGLAFTQELRALGGKLKAVDSAFIPYDDYYTSPRYSFMRLECLPRNAKTALELTTKRLRPNPISAPALGKVIEDALANASRRAASARTTSRELYNAAVLGREHPLTREPELRAEAPTENISAEVLGELWTVAFEPSNMVVSVVTQLPADSIAQILESALPSSSPAAMRTWPGLPLNPEPLLVQEELGKAQAYLRWGYVRAFRPAEEAALRLAVSVLSSRLQDDLRETRGLAYSLGASLFTMGDRAWFSVAGGTRPENLEEMRAGIVSHVDRLRREGASAEEVENAREALLGRMRMRLLSSMGQAYQLGIGEALRGNHDWGAQQMAQLAEASGESINQAAATYLRTDSAVEVVVR